MLKVRYWCCHSTEAQMAAAKPRKLSRVHKESR